MSLTHPPPLLLGYIVYKVYLVRLYSSPPWTLSVGKALLVLWMLPRPQLHHPAPLAGVMLRRSSTPVSKAGSRLK